MLWSTIKDYGLAWSSARLVYELQSRSGLPVRRFSQRSWSENELSLWLSPGIGSSPAEYDQYWRENRRPFFFKSADRSDYSNAMARMLGEQGIKTLVTQADQICNGDFTYFFAKSAHLGRIPDWHFNPFTGQRSSPTRHWSTIPSFSAEAGDIKFIWEPGRFAFAYTLARAYWATCDENYAEAFWRLAESWGDSNPPNQGAHWKCGQEISLRLMTWCFALYAVADSPTTTSERLARMVGMIAAQANRIAGDHIYARLQRNNHSISEGVGLWTTGLLFPELQQSSQWREQGREILNREATKQIALDGSYIQNSTNYHRLMLQDYLWACRLGEISGDPLPDVSLERIQRAVEFLYQLQDSETGQVPCYGHNDGALVLPLSSCDYTDFRPALGAANYLVHHSRLYDAGPWDEDLLWLFGPEALRAPIRTDSRSTFAAPEGGYYTLRGERSHGFTRCATYRYRPAQADMLQVDLWWRGINVVCDPGTYLYYADPPWNNNLRGTMVHNTVTVGSQDQMVPGPRFMWFDWLSAEVLSRECSAGGNVEWFQGQHDGYARLKPSVTHRRAVLRAGDDFWLVVDDLLGEGSQDAVTQWLLYPGEAELDETQNQLRLSLPVGEVQLRWHTWGFEEMSADISCGDEARAPRGWRSRYYGVREPALSLQLAGQGRLPCRIASVFILGHRTQEVRFEDQRIVVTSDEQTLSVTLSDLDSDRLSIREAEFRQAGNIETLMASPSKQLPRFHSGGVTCL